MSTHLTYEQIVELYNSGVKIEDIVRMSQYKGRETIYRILKKQGISTNRNKKIELSEEEIKEIIEIYLSSQNMSAVKIGKMFNISGDSVLKILRMNSVTIRVQPRKNLINEDFFDTLNDDVVNVLFLIFTDGSIHKDLLGFSIIQKDYQMLKEIAYLMGADENIIYDHPSGVHSLIIRSEKMTQSLIKNYGLHPNKSKTIRFPNIPKELYPKMLKGNYEGDGHFGIREASFVTASEDYALSFYDILQEYNLNPKLNVEMSKTTWLFRIFIRGKENLKSLAYILYGNESTFSKESRKKDLLNAYGGLYD